MSAIATAPYGAMPMQTSIALDHRKLPGNWSVQLARLALSNRVSMPTLILRRLLRLVLTENKTNKIR
jgi:hypothetical protein